jgi:hypothetical protein
MLNSPEEYRHWLKCYAQKLAINGDKGRMQELCQWLMGPVIRLVNITLLRLADFVPGNNEKNCIFTNT